MPSRKSPRRVAWLLGATLSAAQAHAEEDLPAAGSALRLNGFGTLGLVLGDNDFGGRFRRDVAQPVHRRHLNAATDSRLGLQANYALLPQWELVGQIVLKERILSNRPKDAVEWAFAAYRPTVDWTLRIGRTSLDAYMMSDYRNVGFAYTMARPVTDYYGIQPLDGLDGLDLTRFWSADDVQWRAKVFAGQAGQRAVVHVPPGVQGQLRGVRGVVLARESEGLLLRGTLARTRVSFPSADVRPLQEALDAVALLPVPSVAAEAGALRRQVNLQDIPVTYMAMGMSYDRQQWLLSAEILRVRTPQTIGSIGAHYFSIGRRWGAVTGYTGLSMVRSTKPMIANPAWADALAPLASVLGGAAIHNIQLAGSGGAAVANANRSDQRTLFLGLRWDFHPQMALKLQWDRIRVNPNGNTLFLGGPGGGRADAATVLVDFVF